MKHPNQHCMCACGCVRIVSDKKWTSAYGSRCKQCAKYPPTHKEVPVTTSLRQQKMKM